MHTAYQLKTDSQCSRTRATTNQIVTVSALTHGGTPKQNGTPTNIVLQHRRRGLKGKNHKTTTNGKHMKDHIKKNITLAQPTPSTATSHTHTTETNKAETHRLRCIEPTLIEHQNIVTLREITQPHPDDKIMQRATTTKNIHVQLKSSLRDKHPQAIKLRVIHQASKLRPLIWQTSPIPWLLNNAMTLHLIPSSPHQPTLDTTQLTTIMTKANPKICQSTLQLPKPCLLRQDKTPHCIAYLNHPTRHSRSPEEIRQGLPQDHTKYSTATPHNRFFTQAVPQQPHTMSF